jgi:hypothetical protein
MKPGKSREHHSLLSFLFLLSFMNLLFNKSEKSNSKNLYNISNINLGLFLYNRGRSLDYDFLMRLNKSKKEESFK